MEQPSETQQTSSRVVFFPGLPASVAAADVVADVGQSADVQKHFFHTDTRRLFIELATESQAQQVVDRFTSGDEINGQQLRVHLSNRQAVSSPETPVVMFTIEQPGPSVSCDALCRLFDSSANKGGIEGRATRRMQLMPPSAQQNHAAQLRGWVEFSSVEAAAAVLRVLQGAQLPDGGGVLALSPSRLDAVRVRDLVHGRDYMTGEGEGRCPPVVPPLQEDAPSVVMVSGLCDGTTPEMLFRLFGTVGDVTAVKIFFAKRNEALVQFRCMEHAHSAARLLRNAPFYYSDGLRVVPARSGVVNGPADELTAYWPPPCPMHRFTGGSASRALRHRCAPASTLHFSNLPARLPRGALPSLVRQVADVTAVRWLPKAAASESGEERSRQALVIFPNVKCAVAALIGLHSYEFEGHELPGGRGITVSFSVQVSEQ
eukprot:TRINITY_DN17965_c0_g1_i1.p1 TRINITY_DN17965_c0_g1~~TRINITY_DN17965_c0_g1_i1.p1  ORF type:complete len:470 (+),score=136.03 TRINITY_DN17965_c0_g1_i1:123-1412(+)